MRYRAYALLAGLVLAGSSARAQDPAADGYIGIFGDAAATECHIAAPVFQPFTAYVYMKLRGRTAPGITGARFRIVGMPPSWFVTPTVSPIANVVIGDPLGQGVEMTFPQCQTGNGISVLLYSFLVFPTSYIPEYVLSVRAALAPYPGLTATLCDAPNFTVVEVGCADLYLNWPYCPCCIGSTAKLGACDVVAVEPAAWGRVKALFR